MEVECSVWYAEQCDTYARYDHVLLSCEEKLEHNKHERYCQRY
jgi:hypothetical protein